PHNRNCKQRPLIQSLPRIRDLLLDLRLFLSLLLGLHQSGIKRLFYSCWPALPQLIGPKRARDRDIETASSNKFEKRNGSLRTEVDRSETKQTLIQTPSIALSISHALLRVLQFFNSRFGAAVETSGAPCRMAVHSLILIVPLLLLTAAGTASAQCSSSPVPKEVNETSPVGTVIEVLDSSYNQVATPTIDAVYACYFELVNSTLRLKRQFNLENFTSCVDDSTVTPLSPQSIQIGCSGGGVTATFLVRLVDVNEFPPTFEPNVFRVNVSEAIALGTSIIQLNSYVKDKDFSNVRTFNILIVSGSNNDFGMNSGITSGIVTVQRALDYDAGPRQYVMNISAADLAYESTSLPLPLTGYATLIVDVQDADDLSPVFSESSYSLYFMENDTSYLNRSLETSPVLLARDGDIGINQTINYAIESGSKLGNAYQTDKPTSRISVTLCLVTVGDKNDNAPVMSSGVYNVSVAENSLINTYVTAVKASDADLGENATFIFVLNDTTGAFQIDANSGLVTVANPALLDREARSSFTILVWARESLTPEQFASPASQLTVNLIDVNDNAPAFNASSYAFVVSEDALVGTPIGAVFATDGDADVASGNGRIGRYDIVWSGSGVSA
uniref:Cadherin domain-containing protein n=1 Tax=Macrostomum lignano TaxID=282301 RepID=A0A1I8GCH4_9PLAT